MLSPALLADTLRHPYVCAVDNRLRTLGENPYACAYQKGCVSPFYYGCR